MKNVFRVVLKKKLPMAPYYLTPVLLSAIPIINSEFQYLFYVDLIVLVYFCSHAMNFVIKTNDQTSIEQIN